MHIKRMKVIIAECFRLPFENKRKSLQTIDWENTTKSVARRTFGKKSHDSRKS